MAPMTTGTWRIERIAGLLLGMLVACPGPGPETPGAVEGTGRTVQEALKNGVARVREATVSLVDSTGTSPRALLEVRYQAVIKPGTTVTLRPDDRDVVLRDDGQKGDRAARDGVFSSLIDLNLGEFQAEQRRISPQLMARAQVPQFEGRVRVKPIPLRPELFFDFRERPFPFPPIPLFPVGIPDPNLPERSLIIRDPAVVEDPTRTFNPCTGVGAAQGVWTFGHLMTQMANQAATGIPVSKFARAWLAQWETPQTVNSFTIPARTSVLGRIINPWLQASGGSKLDMTKAPFRLLAIVNRVDLRQNLVYGGGSAGEARFVFGAVDLASSCAPLPFTVIFEYGIKKNSCTDLKAWARQWYDLRALPPSDPTYRTQLQAITDQFVTAGANPSQLPNKNALNQLRTNERAIGRPWELREFQLDSGASPPGLLSSVTVKQEPDMSFNNGLVLANYVNTNAAAIVLDQHKVPEQFAGNPFLGARAPIPGDNIGFFWGRGADMTTANSRFHLSLNTCSGCHTGETGTRFTHIDPMTGPPAALSGFLTGIPITDPDPSDADNSVRQFNDLQRRAVDLDGLVSGPCLRQLGFRPIVFMVH